MDHPAVLALQEKLAAIHRCSHCDTIVRKEGTFEPVEMLPCPRCARDVCARCAEHPFPSAVSPWRVLGSCR
jgi:hypothetical protein